MPGKLEYYSQMAEQAAKQITGSNQTWTAFLRSVGRFYKYPYPEQIMIHAQRPDATACADYDTWKDKMGRYVRRGSKGIALIDSSGDSPRLHYVFDVSDTGARPRSRSVNLWQLNEGMEDGVRQMFAEEYGLDDSQDLPEQIEVAAAMLADEAWEANKRDIADILANSFLDGYDDSEAGASFKSAVAVSAAYAILSRCGLAPERYFSPDDFMSVFDWNTPETAAAIGTAVSSISEQVLRSIERNVRKQEREQSAERSQNGRTEVQTDRGLSDPGPSPDRDGGAAPREVREDAEGLSEGASPDPVQSAAPEREAVPASAGDRRDGAPEAGADAPADGEEGRRDGEAQGLRPDEVGRPDEQPKSPGRGDHPYGAGVQLSLFPSEEETIRAIDEAESVSETPFAFSPSQEDVDTILRFGSNSDRTRMHLAAAFARNNSVENRAALMQAEYHGGYGLNTETGKLSAWYDEAGIRIARGTSARYVQGAVLIPWDAAAARVSELLDNGTFATNVEIAEAPGNERMELAEKLLYMQRDLSDDAKEVGELATVYVLSGGGFPEAQKRLADALADPEKRKAIQRDVARFYTNYRANPSLLRFHYHDPGSLVFRLLELDLSTKEYSSDLAELPAVSSFITEDELDAAIAGGSSFEGGKGRIYRYFTEDHSIKEKAKFLKDEYGTGGRSHAVSGSSRSGEDHSSKGERFTKKDCAPVELSWTAVAKRIDTLIARDRYLTPEEKEALEAPHAEPVPEMADEAMPVLERAKELINEYCDREFGTDRDFEDLSSIGLAYTETEDSDIPVQVNADLVNFRIDCYLGDYLAERRQYDSLTELISNELEGLDFNELTNFYTDDMLNDVSLLRDYHDVENAHPGDIVLYQVGDAFRVFGTDARYTAELLNLPMANNLSVEVEACEFPAQMLPEYLDLLREKYDVTVSSEDQKTGERETASFLSFDHEADRAQNAHEAEFGSDGFRAFRDEEAMQTQAPALGQLQRYKPAVLSAVTEDRAYRNACASSDPELARIEANAAVRRYILNSGDMQLIKLFSDDSEFRTRLHQEVFDESYSSLHELLRPLSQDDIDDAIRAWNGRIESKHAVVRYMREHAQVEDTAAWLAREYGGEDLNGNFTVRAGSPEAAELTWQMVQQRITQLIRDNRFYTEQEQDNFDDIDPIAIRERLAAAEQNGGSPFVRQVMEDAEQIAAQEAAAEEPSVPELSPERMEQIVEAFEAADLSYDNINSYGGYLVFNGEGSVYSFESWAAAEDWIEGVIFDEPERNEAVERVLHPERYEQQDAAPEFPFRPGDKVYLEDGKPFIIEQIGQFDIQLRDPSLRYPILRAESRESFARLLAHYPQPEQSAAREAEAVPSEPVPFVYQGYSFVPVGRLPEGSTLENTTPFLASDPSLGLSRYENARRAYSHDAFYAASGNSSADVFRCVDNGKLYLPGDNELFEYTGDAAALRELTVDQEKQSQPEAAQQPEPPAAPELRTVAVYPSERTNLPYDIVIQTIGAREPDPPAENYHITDDHLGEGGPKAKFRANMEAIRVLKQLEAENRAATPEEQETLSRYVGWGGLPDAFDPDKSAWASEYAELKDALTDAEYAAARASTLNAHYTSPTVIRAIYDALGNMGFSSGNILEPAMGVGNFFGMLPQEMSDSKLYGVELDSITGRIAQKLYPQANITVAGFETTDRRDFYDVAVGNVPFGNYTVNDPAYNKLGFSIHDYFFAKALDQLRPGGVMAFVTSRYTLDKQTPDVRKYLAERANLLGAIRLPNNAFRANAGTDVVSDIVFLQKKEQPSIEEPDWVHLDTNEQGFSINSYFVDHPEMILGRQSSENTQYGREDFTVEPIDGLDLKDQLADAIKYIRGSYREAEFPDLGENEEIDTSIPADPNVRNYSYTVVDGEVYYRQNSRMVQPKLSATAKERIKGMVELRDCMRGLIDLQMDGSVPDEALAPAQQRLSELYDRFTEKYGILNSRLNEQAFADDSAYFLLCSLENIDEDRKFKSKSEFFTRRTIQPHEVVTHTDTAEDALVVSISEKACVDMDYMQSLSGMSEDELYSRLRGVIFCNPDYGADSSQENRQKYLPADQYLSGNVRHKLAVAKSAAYSEPDLYAANVEALERAQPRDLEASEIDARLGATWIDKSYIEQFMYETFQTPRYQQWNIRVNYSPLTAEWGITAKSSCNYNDVTANVTYGTSRANAYKILEDTLNLRDVRIYDTVQDPDGKERRVLNSKETTLAQQKQQAIKDAFRDWIWKDPARRQALVKRYNELFNSTRPREYDGSHITFSGINPDIQLREHQLNAIAHVLYGGNTLLAHEVGSGKTFEMVAAAMESKRLGLCTKPLFAVPNHLIGQWAQEFLRLYPSANILVASRKDFEPRNRKKFCARIATGNYDAIILGHSQFEKIPVSQERQERLLQDQIEEIAEGIAQLKYNRSEKFTVKQMEKTKKGLEAKLKKLQEGKKHDDVVTFEELGVDKLFVDEAQNYKNLFLYTKMRNVAGLSTTDAQKSSDMYLKCRYLDELTGGKGVVFATGTPVSNSMTELYTMMRYLQHDMLQAHALNHFDCWASTFGETTTAIELAPEGTGYRARTRFAKFFNLPELMQLFREAADIKTSDQLNLPRPDAVYHNVVAQPTDIQKEMVKQLSERASRVHSGSVNPSEDNMLKITSDGRKLGLDQRIINPALPDDPQSKVNQCVDNVFRIWEDGTPKKLTQLVFCDLSTPTVGKPAQQRIAAKAVDNLSEEGQAIEAPVDEERPFNVYDDIREKLVARGVPREEIAFIHEANSDAKKKGLFAKVRTGQVRVLIGSTFKMGAGTNVQDRLIALHDLDAPWRPGDLEQRSGRIIRQGNENPEVHIYRYVTEATFDAYLWQTLENKQKFISQIMTSKSPVRSCEDVDETSLSYAEIKALCAGDPRIKEKMDLDIDVARLRLMKANHNAQQYRLEDKLMTTFPEQVEHLKRMIAGYEADIKLLASHPHPKDGFAGMRVRGDQLLDKENAGAALLDAMKDAHGLEPLPAGSYRGFQMFMTLEDFGRDYVLTLKGELPHRVTLGKDARGNLVRIDNALNAMEDRLRGAKAELENTYSQMENARAELGKPFPQEDELQAKSARLVELNNALDIDKQGGEPPVSDEPELPKSTRVSVLEKLKEAGESLKAQATASPYRKQEATI